MYQLSLLLSEANRTGGLRHNADIALEETRAMLRIRQKSWDYRNGEWIKARAALLTALNLGDDGLEDNEGDK